MVDFEIRHPHTSFLTTTAGRIGHVKQQHNTFKFKGARDASASQALGKFSTILTIFLLAYHGYAHT
jgi:hypothetical protein